MEGKGGVGRGPVPAWAARADAWFKALGAIVLAGLILSRITRYLAAFSDVVAIAIGGLFLAYLFYPVVRRLNARLPLWAALSIVYAAFFVVLATGLVFVVPTALEQLRSLISNLPRYEISASYTLLHPHGPLAEIPASVRVYLAKLPSDVSAYVAKNSASVTSTVTTAIFSLAAIAALLIAIPVVSIYMLAESFEMKRFVAYLLPERYRPHTLTVLGEIEDVVGGFIRGQIIVAGAVAVLSTTALVILHVPYALLIGIWAGLADIVPYVGPFAGGIPALAVALGTNGWTNAVWVVVAFVTINQIEAHVLAPRIVARTVRVTPLTVIFALLVGAHIFGFIGLLLAVPLAGVVRVIVDHLLEKRRPPTVAEIQPGLTPEPRSEVLPDDVPQPATST